MADFKNLPHLKYDYEKPDPFHIDPMKPLIEEFIANFRIQEEDHIMKAVSDVGISVDKPRLIQALTDARAFYEEGYRAAMNRPGVVEVRHGEWVHCDGKSNLWYCSECGDKILYNPTRRTYNIRKRPVNEVNKYCRCCGAKMDGKGDGE